MNPPPEPPRDGAWLSAWDALTEPVWVMDTGHRIQRCNQAAQKLYGGKLVGRHCWEVVHGTAARGSECPLLDRCRDGGRQSTELLIGARWYHCTVDPLAGPDGKISGGLHVLWDITQRKAAEISLRNLNARLKRRVAERTAELQEARRSLSGSEKRLRQFIGHARSAHRTLQAIRDCHEAMLRASTERELLDEVCRIIVQSGGERLAWVGFAETDPGKTVRAAAAAGIAPDHLRTACVTWADVPRGRGPVGTAVRTGKPCLCRDTQRDPNFSLWRDAAQRYGWGSVIALPLMADRGCFGALAIYASGTDAFDADEQLMLTDLANDLAFGINTLRLRAERERLENEILKSIEHEQRRIGRDLHDGLCQLLVGAKYRSVYLQKISARRSPAVAREARALEELLDHSIQQARDLARGLNPVQVTSAGLAAALRKLADDTEGAHRVHCFCQFPKPVKVPDHQAAYHLYRIAQEAVQNALKHAGAKNISITLARLENRTVLTVKDDGAGLPSGRKKAGMGLNNMQTRARLIGGRLEIRRRQHGGTAVSCELPGHRKSDHEPPP